MDISQTKRQLIHCSGRDRCSTAPLFSAWYSTHNRSDNGPEFVAKTVCRWLQRADVGTLLFAKGSPWENRYIESAGGKLRDELLNQQVFLSLVETR